VSFVCLNTLLWSVKNANFTKKDADDQLEWLDNLLKNSKTED